jgi:putative DNA primase/helicase
LVRGCLDWQSHGLAIPAEIRAARHDYHEEEDTLGGFIRECYILDPLASIPASQLYERYKAWAIENGLKAISNITFGMQMRERLKWRKVTKGAFYNGVKCRVNEDDAESMTEPFSD